jgi:hypothetical protein
MNTFKAVFTCLLFILPASTLLAQEITECDILIAHPSDPQHVGEGISSSKVILQKAIPACREALANDPKNPRFHYQLGRGLVYWADTNNGDISEGLEHVKHASDMGYTQAMFVHGLMQKRYDRWCEAESITKAAADQGLKSARISYVDDFLAGKYSECELSATPDEMTAYLEAASSQVSGWYENMLMGALKRELAEQQES